MAKGFINATDCADYLTKKGMPFRDAYKCTGTMVAACIREGKTLEELTLDEFKQYSDLFAEDVYTAIDLTTCCEGPHQLRRPHQGQRAEADRIGKRETCLKGYLRLCRGRCLHRPAGGCKHPPLQTCVLAYMIGV